jgi:O-antigen/teichoic acid export membrane protein
MMRVAAALERESTEPPAPAEEPGPEEPPAPVPLQSENGFHRIIRNASVLLGGKAANAVLSLAHTAIAARALGVQDFGILILIHAFASAVADCVEFQSWQAVLHFGVQPLASGARSLLQRVIRFSLMLDLLSGIAGVLIGGAIVLFLQPLMAWPEAVRPLALAYCLCIAFRVMATPTGVLRLLDRFDLLAGQSAMASLVRLIGSLGVWLLGGRLASFLGVWFAAEAVACFALFGLAWHELRRQGHLHGFRWWDGPLTADLPGIWRFSWTTNLNSALTLAFGHVGVLVVGSALGPAGAALYRIARQVANAVAKPAQLALPALYPELARLWRDRAIGDLYRLTLQTAASAGGMATALLLLAMVAGAPLLDLVAGPAFRSAAPLMLWLLAAAVIGIWSLPLEPLLISTGQASAAVWVRAGVTLLYLPLLFLFLEKLGLIGAGYVTVIATALLSVIQLILVLRRSRYLRGAAVRGLPG